MQLGLAVRNHHGLSPVLVQSSVRMCLSLLVLLLYHSLQNYYSQLSFTPENLFFRQFITVTVTVL